MTEFDKKDYWDRRKKNLRGQRGAAIIHTVVKDTKGKEKRIPIGNKVGPKGTGLREASRRTKFSKDRDFTKPNVEYRKGREIDPWKGHNPGSTFQVEHPPYPMTNKQRMANQRAIRESERARKRAERVKETA